MNEFKSLVSSYFSIRLNTREGLVKFKMCAFSAKNSAAEHPKPA